MPQLDFFTVKAQFFCLLLSLFFIYSLLLKYAIPNYDVFKRLKIKKIIFYRLRVEFLNFLSMTFTKNSSFYLRNINSFVNDFLKTYISFLVRIFPIFYFIILKKNSEKVEATIRNMKPLYSVLLNSSSNSIKNNKLLKSPNLTKEDYNKILNL